VFTKVIKTPSRKAWVLRPSDVIKSGREHKVLIEESTLVKLGVNTYN
jgi:hypothetical protein